MKGIITGKKGIARATLMVVFQINEEFSFKPGQFFFVTLPQLHYPDSRGNRRHFSIVNSPEEKGVLEFATRIREESGFKKTLQDLEIGTEVELGPIAGNFVLPEKIEKPLVFIAGGIGITPFVSMLRSVKSKQLKYQVTVLFSNKDKDYTPFFEELSKYSQENGKIKVVFIMTEDNEWTGEKRHIDQTLIQEYFPDVNNQTYYIAGAPKMVEAVVMSLREAGAAEENIVSENFSGY